MNYSKQGESMNPIVLERIDLLDMISSLDNYSGYLKEQLSLQHSSIEDTPLRNELVTATWLGEKLSSTFMSGTHPTHKLRPDEWECLLQALETHIGSLNYSLDTLKQSTPYNTTLNHEIQLMNMNLRQVCRIKNDILNLSQK